LSSKEKMQSIKPIQDYLLVQIARKEEQTTSGIVIPGKKADELRGDVLEVGGKVKHVKKGDKIIYRRYCGDKVKLGSKTILLIQEKDILAIE